MNKEEIEDALFCLEVDRLNNKQIKLLSNYIDKLQQELKDSINARFELQRRIDKTQKEIDDLIKENHKHIDYIASMKKKHEDKIRNKIKELEKDIEVHSIYEENWNKIEVLKELLGDE